MASRGGQVASVVKQRAKRVKKVLSAASTQDCSCPATGAQPNAQGPGVSAWAEGHGCFLLGTTKFPFVGPTSSKAEHISETHGDRIQTQPNTKAALVMDLGSIYTQGSHKCRHTAETPSSSLACRERKAQTENFIGSQAPTNLEIIPVRCIAPQSTQHLCPDLKPSSWSAYSPASSA